MRKNGHDRNNTSLLLMGHMMKCIAQIMRVASVVEWYDAGCEGEPPDLDTLTDDDLDLCIQMPGASSIDFAIRICHMQDMHEKEAARDD